MYDLSDIKKLNNVVAFNKARVAEPRNVDPTGNAPRVKHTVVGLPSGHAGQGGLQGHSVGEQYPWCAVAFGNGEWQGQNLSTGETLPRRKTQAEVVADIEARRRVSAAGSEA